MAKTWQEPFLGLAPAWALRCSHLLVNGGYEDTNLNRERVRRLLPAAVGAAGFAWGQGVNAYWRATPIAGKHGRRATGRQESTWQDYQSLIVLDTSEPTARCRAMPSSYVIGDHFESFIKEQIQQGRYASASEVVRDALRALEDREKFRAVKLDALRSEIQRGADSGAGIPAKAVFAAVRKRIARSGAGSGGR